MKELRGVGEQIGWQKEQWGGRGRIKMGLFPLRECMIFRDNRLGSGLVPGPKKRKVLLTYAKLKALSQATKRQSKDKNVKLP